LQYYALPLVMLKSNVMPFCPLLQNATVACEVRTKSPGWIFGLYLRLAMR
jgi:hypothetical protein